jgi:phosphatidylglycerol---prolipoprotein diacylglyceryl transferase
MYALGFFVCYTYVKKYGYIREIHMDTLLLFIFLWVIVGGRLGYIVLYQPSYLWAYPLEILMIWKGGMSFHGWAIWVILAMIIFSYRYRYRLYDISDPLVAILPIALGLGRIGNYINSELLGYSPYSGPFAMIRDGISHFPSPLFQAFLEWIILLSAMQYFRWCEKKMGRVPWYASALFLIGYAFLRIFAEFFRLPDAHVGYLLSTGWLTLGMVYTLPMIVLGIWIYISTKSHQIP